MAIDVLVLGLAGLFGLVGYFTGFWSQLIRLAALLSAYLLAGPVGRLFAAPLAAGLEIPPLLGRMLATGLAFIFLYMVLSGSGWALLRSWRRRCERHQGRGRSQADRWGGVVLGAGKVFALLYLVLCLAVLAEKSLAGKFGSGTRLLRQSRLAALARRHNLLTGLHLPVVGNVAGLARLAADPQRQERLAASPQVKRLLEHPKVKALADDQALQRAARRRDVAALLANPRLNALLQDPEIMSLLEQIDLAAVP